MKILTVDDNETNLKVVSSYLSGMGYEVLVADSGEKAVEMYQQDKPELVLMDIMMPGMDGYEATRQIKQLAGTTWVPVIFMSALGQDDDKVKGLEVGADDYLSKPVEFKVLAAKIKAMQRISDMQQALVQTSDELQAYKDAAESEHATAKELMDHIVNRVRLEDTRIHRWNVAADNFSGDLVVYNKSSSGRIYMMVADSTGHGLTAALPIVPVSQIFYAMTDKGFSVSAIVEEMNTQLSRIMPISRFVAASVVSIDTNNGSFEVWNGGNPAIYYYDPETDVLTEFNASNPALGIMPAQQFNSATDAMVASPNGVIVMYSDGLLDLENESGELLGEDRLVETIKKPGSCFENIQECVNTFRGNARTRDDISLIVMECSR